MKLLSGNLTDSKAVHPKKADAPIQKIDISTLSKNEPVSEIKNESMSETKTDEPMITVPVKWLEKVICQR